MRRKVNLMPYRKLVIAALLLVLAAGVASGEEQKTMPNQGMTGECSDCHYSEKPGNDDLLPRRCTRYGRAPDAVKPQSDAAAPDVFILDKLSDIYVPVVFPHKLHAAMETMSFGCGVCHHHSETGKGERCEKCHPVTGASDNLQKPGLKGAYHRQCLGCHREWSHETDCSVCHAKRDPTKKIEEVVDAGDITGRLHPNVEVPTKLIYPTPNLEDGTMVTFHHKQHVDLYGHRCVECHRKENCNRCHDGAGPQKHLRKDPHEDCEQCHDVSDKCDSCHMKEESKGFNHAERSSFMLKSYHVNVACNKCHKQEGVFKGLSKDCDTCHGKDWFPEKFDHVRAGLMLNEAHSDIECRGCHVNGLSKPPECGTCHDDNRVFTQTAPGTLTGPMPILGEVPKPEAPKPEAPKEGGK